MLYWYADPLSGAPEKLAKKGRTSTDRQEGKDTLDEDGFSPGVRALGDSGRLKVALVPQWLDVAVIEVEVRRMVVPLRRAPMAKTDGDSEAY
eukprot:CAMPEP_0116845874 /NCGR_PEP_ID=MMETSP0418-20121206/13522_1 /TAXON_ID=1158023 /ORGANISM="Astrosyne radiata, Strain 13vi08-1A" /LENGTH=91 /DNA_ID=CAMNT_0004477059 /DNA_START=163 /DNA_END=438 /DNA_ORIENTATION=+